MLAVSFSSYFCGPGLGVASAMKSGAPAAAAGACRPHDKDIGAMGENCRNQQLLRLFLHKPVTQICNSLVCATKNLNHWFVQKWYKELLVCAKMVQRVTGLYNFLERRGRIAESKIESEARETTK